ncbi:MAG: hypothetical protein R3245_02170, partial [Kiloniellales bacterium]|nr:hypothetical protein [Kiloniellales bacterium]
EGRVLLLDDDYYYMAAVVAERIHSAKSPVIFVTPAGEVSAWARYTAEQARSRRRLMELGVEFRPAHGLLRFDGKMAVLACEYTGRQTELAADSLVLVTARRPNDQLYYDLLDRTSSMSRETHKSLRRIGDCEAPAIIAAAVYAGHRYARELDSQDPSEAPIRRDRFLETS